MSVPAVVAIDTGGRVLCGDDAEIYAAHHPERTVFGVKRLLGRKLYSTEVTWLAGMSAVEVVPSDDGDAYLRIGERRYSPQELCAYLLRHVTSAVQRELGQPIASAVIATPCLFDIAQRHALLDAARIAGLRVQRFVEAAAAAALELSLPERAQRVVAVDLGGGYFDVCMLERRGAGWHVRGVDGDSLLGGDDFDRRLVDALVAEFHKQHGADLTQRPHALRRLWQHSRDLRHHAPEVIASPSARRLSDLGTIQSRKVDLVLPPLQRADLEALWTEELDGFWGPCARLFEDLGLGTDDVDGVIMLGGGLRTWRVAELLEEMFRHPAVRPLDSGALVAQGAARLGEGSGADELLRGINAHTLGVKARHGRVKAFIRRNKPLPCDAQRIFSTPNARSLVLEVYQGDSELARDNLYVGRFSLALGAADRHIVRFSVDRHGLLGISAQDAITSKPIPVEERFSSGLGAAERQAIIDGLASETTLREAIARDKKRKPDTDVPPSDATPQPRVPITGTPSFGEGPGSDAPPRSVRGASRRPMSTPSPDSRTPGTLPSRGTHQGLSESDPSEAQPLEGESLVGTTIGGRYAIDRVIAQGGMGRVYHATHKILDREYAVKVIHPELAGNASLVERFLREAKSAARIKSEHVVEILDFGTMEDGTSYFVMEYVEGRLLARVLDQRPMSNSDVLMLSIQIARGLSAAHRLDIVHRDLKPDNILLVGEGEEQHVKIFDFGIAKSPTSDGQALTLIDSFVGTPHYMAPEQVAGTVDGRTDIYALGIVMYEMITGAPPFDHESVALLLHMQRTEAPRPLREHPAGKSCPPALEEVISRCLEKDPADRYQSADALGDALSALLR